MSKANPSGFVPHNVSEEQTYLSQYNLVTVLQLKGLCQRLRDGYLDHSKLRCHSDVP